MQGSDQGLPTTLAGTGLKIGIVQARFNHAITSALAKNCIGELHAMGVDPANIEHHQVPGALEVGVALAAMAESKRFDALIALGCIIRGETYHFELVANESGAAVTRLSLDHKLPIANAVLTVENEAQAWARADEKGRDAGRVAVEMAHLMKALK